MKRQEFIRELVQAGCHLLRHGNRSAWSIGPTHPRSFAGPQDQPSGGFDLGVAVSSMRTGYLLRMTPQTYCVVL